MDAGVGWGAPWCFRLFGICGGLVELGCPLEKMTIAVFPW
jgi:hypothetical protein